MSTNERDLEMTLPAPDGAEWPTTSKAGSMSTTGHMAELDAETLLAPPASDETPQKEMCCDGSGRTAEQHRAESPDHKCCIDH